MNVNAETLLTGPAPHIRTRVTVATAMKDVMIALIPITLISLYIFGLGAVLVIATCVTGAILGEIVARRMKGEKATLHDGTALVTGLLLAMTLPPTAWWAVVPLYTFGGFISIAVFREYMGGIGWNRFNPAVAGRLFLLIGRTSLVYMAPFLLGISSAFEPYLMKLGAIDAVSKATPLMSANLGLSLPSYSYFLGAFEGGALAETSVLAMLLGGAYLLYKGHINWRIPLSMIGTVFILSFVAGADPIFHVLAGGLLLGAFFMATDWVTSPISFKGQLIYGVAIGALIVFFRLVVARYWVPDGGVVFAILIMNALVPAIDRATRRPKFGEVRSNS